MNVISRRGAFRACQAHPKARTTMRAAAPWQRSAPFALILLLAGPASAAPLTLDDALRRAESRSLALPAQDASPNCSARRRQPGWTDSIWSA